MNLSKVKKNALLLGLAVMLSAPVNAFAAEAGNSQPSQKEVQESSSISESGFGEKELRRQIDDIEKELKELRKKKAPASNEAMEQMNEEILSLNQRLIEQQSDRNILAQIMERLEKMEAAQNIPAYPAASQSMYLVDPGQQEEVSYTQDAANSQGNSTMVFRYAPNQLYKIYCRVGYLTDLSLRKGKTISFVGGGDTSAWAVSTSTVDGVPHLYIKPTVETSTTNLIVTTDKRSYQLILTTGTWYNPMVTWTYGQEEAAEARFQQQKDERTLAATFKGSLESLHFGYNVSGSTECRLAMVFDDGEKTILKFDKLPARIPALFIKERGKKGVSLANYTVHGNCYILDRVVDELELRSSDKESVKIRRRA